MTAWTMIPLVVLAAVVVVAVGTLVMVARQSPASEPPSAPGPDPAVEAPPVLAKPPMIGGETLRDWLIHYHRQRPPLAGEPLDDVWSAVVKDFYAQAAKDPEIARYFAGVDMDALCRHFLAALLVLTHTGLTTRAADTLGEKHAHLGITPTVFDKTTGVLVQVLQDHGVPWAAVEQLVPAVTELRKRIVTNVGVQR